MKSRAPTFTNSIKSLKIVVVISDASIKNNVTMSISHIDCSYNIMAKTIHHTINITTTEAELFAIRCGIN